VHEPRSNKIIVNRSPERENPIAASARARGDQQQDYQEYNQAYAQASINPFNTNFIGPQAHQANTSSFFGVGSGGGAITPRHPRHHIDEDFEIKP
jgi:hypothetical protein